MNERLTHSSGVARGPARSHDHRRQTLQIQRTRQFGWCPKLSAEHEDHVGRVQRTGVRVNQAQHVLVARYPAVSQHDRGWNDSCLGVRSKVTVSGGRERRGWILPLLELMDELGKVALLFSAIQADSGRRQAERGLGLEPASALPSEPVWASGLG